MQKRHSHNIPFSSMKALINAVRYYNRSSYQFLSSHTKTSKYSVMLQTLVFLGVSMFLIVIMWRKVLQGEILKLNITAWFLSITDTFCFSVVMIGKNGNIPQSHNFWKQWHRSYINTTFRFTHGKDDEWQKSLMTTVKTTLMFVHK